MVRLCAVCLIALSLARGDEPKKGGASATPAVPDGTLIRAVLTGTISAKEARVGDVVHLSVTQKVRTPEGRMLIPSKAQLFGRVTAVSPRSEGQKHSWLSFVVESAEWKNESVRLNAFLSGEIMLPGGRGEILDGIRVEVTGGILVIDSSPTSADTRPRDTAPDPRRAPLTGVMLKKSADPKITTILVSERADIVLEKGTSLVLRQQALPLSR